ncbi:hypothetical protein LDL08_12420 [Nonomuraea glycinis]|uniref:Uncharacterized protein n=1 Tax=Nonomuraea glycinis TaxID=2047744 RepID=A0A918E2I6_9ACTN|nr:hypothetical protein [Nonomuraea glycinis]MCA2176988.1 hypothetical protein [Nonomuraea glycinis]GGP02907.1 hypothetical protein GCM10012278_12000 [Nonomuraea glycinis]
MHKREPFPFELSVTVSEPTPHGIEEAAYPVAERFFGDGAELHVVSAKVEPDLTAPGNFRATVTFRKLST